MGAERSKHTRSQCDKILAHMQSGKGISQYEAAQKYGCYRLSARIWDLREQGYDISKTMVTKKNSEGNSVSFAVYRLEGGAE